MREPALGHQEAHERLSGRDVVAILERAQRGSPSPMEISRSLAKNPIPIVDGHASAPEEPGLGVEPDPAIIEKYLVQ
jgi:L-alanine-DL-glutamate epimerase-like enolase superfamily enzyme